ncbi:MAG TPA: hypothetical protein DDW52_23340 [Planctomycetaceae bacterium]|nr:hypothetical protein [Planctomycetaceae bacterium]
MSVRSGSSTRKGYPPVNDYKLSELISKSLSGNLSGAEESNLSDSLRKTSTEAQSFARLSSIIQQSVCDVASDEGVIENTGEQLSEIAKERLRKSIRAARSSVDQAGAVESEGAADSDGTLGDLAPTKTLYFEGTPELSGSSQDVAVSGPRHFAGSDELPEDSRHAVSRFTITKKIGEGGLGTVWLARDEKLKRNVALKEMKPGAVDSAKLWKRFQREAEITGQLEHPNVVPLYMSGVNPETGLPFYAMRFLGKKTLLDAIREFHAREESSRDVIQLHRLLGVFIDVCQAIAFAHSRGVIHRDLKPENVALDNFGQVLVLDWGLAKLETDGEIASRFALSGDLDDSAVAQTIQGDVVGTPLYMSPEQAAGAMDDLDSRTDVYGLGAILFAILTGYAPHEKSSRSKSANTKVSEFLEAIAKGETPRPSDLNPQVPRDLELICLKAMDKNRYARHESAQELASDIEAWIAGKHERQAKYDTMRMAGRDLKSRLCVQMRQLITTTQFMVELPPIQGLLASLNADDGEYATWRERLSTILLALAKSRTNLTGLSYSQISGDKINELVRIERSLQDLSNIRSLPQSRLRRGAASTFHKTVLQQFPGEACIDLDFSTAGQVRVVCGVPVFDENSEEPFGLVVAEAEISNFVQPEIAISGGAKDRVMVIDDRSQVIFDSKSPAKYATTDVNAHDVVDRWEQILATPVGEEYIESDREYYASGLMFPQNHKTIRIVLQVDSES